MASRDQRPRVGFVVPYMGTLPRWSKLFFESCRRNPCVDVLLFVQEVPDFPLPENVKCHKMVGDSIVQRIRAFTGLALQDLRGHKLCDFRPFFGGVFADELRGYDFWGYCDIDMMFGDLGRFLTHEFCGSFDAFSAHDRQFVGHFTLLRNTDEINRLGFRIDGWRELCRTQRAEHLDEERFSEAIGRIPGVRWARPGGFGAECAKAFCSFGITFGLRGEVVGAPEYPYAVAKWDSGKVYFCPGDGRKIEALYVHFMGTKQKWHWPLRAGPIDPKGPHFFSRIGYGRVETAQDVKAPGAKVVFCAQSLAREAKRVGGKVLRTVLAEQQVNQVRRRLGV